MNVKHICPHCGSKTTIDRTEYFVSVGCENCLQYWSIEQYDTCCQSPNLQISKLITSSGTVQVKNQCTNCGEVAGSALGGYTKEQKETLPVVDRTKREEYSTAKWNLINLFHNKRKELQERRQANKETLWWNAYKAYLNSPTWISKRSKTLARDNHTCQACLQNRATQVHHKTYEHVDFRGSEPLFDLVSICNQCHDLLHRVKELKKAS